MLAHGAIRRPWALAKPTVALRLTAEPKQRVRGHVAPHPQLFVSVVFKNRRVGEEIIGIEKKGKLFGAGPSNPFRAVVPFWRQTSQISSSLSPKRDCGSKGNMLRETVCCRAAYAVFRTYDGRQKNVFLLFTRTHRTWVVTGNNSQLLWIPVTILTAVTANHVFPYICRVVTGNSRQLLQVDTTVITEAHRIKAQWIFFFYLSGIVFLPGHFFTSFCRRSYLRLDQVSRIPRHAGELQNSSQCRRKAEDFSFPTMLLIAKNMMLRMRQRQGTRVRVSIFRRTYPTNDQDSRKTYSTIMWPVLQAFQRCLIRENPAGSPVYTSPPVKNSNIITTYFYHLPSRLQPYTYGYKQYRWKAEIIGFPPVLTTGLCGC